MHDQMKATIRPSGIEFDLPDTKAELTQLIEGIRIKQHTILGIDIYPYSQYPAEFQPFIPFLFSELYNAALNLLFQNFSCIFQISSAETIRNWFIGTGDGGFQAFDILRGRSQEGRPPPRNYTTLE